MPLITGTSGARTGTWATSSRIAPATSARSGEWNARDTSSGVTFTPRASRAADARRTASVVPETTVCPG